MSTPFRDLLKHSGLYGLGQVLARLASFLLLPLYTNCLSPADYGCVAILDLAVATMAILMGSGLTSAVTRFHFDAQDELQRARVWWTGFLFHIAISTALVIPAFLGRSALALVTLGPEVSEGAYYYALSLPMLWLLMLGQLPDNYFRVRKWSGMTVVFSLAHLLVNIALNVYFLTVLDLGIVGLLWGNLIARAMITVVQLAVFVRELPPPAFDAPLAKKLCGFGLPLVGTALLALVMHQADRYLLRHFVSLEDIGVYSIAYQISHAVSTLLHLPFAAIWGVVLYEIAEQPSAKQAYARIFEIFSFGFLLVMLCVSLHAKLLLSFVVAPEYAEAAHLIPVICLAYYFFTLHEQFKAPAFLSKRTVSLLPCFIVGAALNVGLNLLLIPWMGVAGAAWATLATFVVFSGTGWLLYRRIDPIAYPFGRCGAVLAGMILTYLGWAWLDQGLDDWRWSLLVSVSLCVLWAVGLFHRYIPQAVEMLTGLAKRFRSPLPDSSSTVVATSNS